jgi:hypothetical protein
MSNKEARDYEDLRSMELHEVRIISDRTSVMRVPNGLIYRIASGGSVTANFVSFPFEEDFEKQEEWRIERNKGRDPRGSYSPLF